MVAVPAPSSIQFVVWKFKIERDHLSGNLLRSSTMIRICSKDTWNRSGICASSFASNSHYDRDDRFIVQLVREEAATVAWNSTKISSLKIILFRCFSTSSKRKTPPVILLEPITSLLEDTRVLSCPITPSERGWVGRYFWWPCAIKRIRQRLKRVSRRRERKRKREKEERKTGRVGATNVEVCNYGSRSWQLGAGGSCR